MKKRINAQSAPQLPPYLQGIMGLMPPAFFMKDQGMPSPVRGFVEGICRKLHSPVPDFLGSDASMPVDSAYTSIRQADDKVGIYVHPDVETVPDWKGMVAHEVGHFYLKHMPMARNRILKTYATLPNINQGLDLQFLTPRQYAHEYRSNHADEFAADAFAKEQGYGEPLIRHLKRHSPEVIDVASFSHPSTAERLARLKVKS